jgi:hypothetical protein
VRRELVRTLLINAVAPYVLYMLCEPHTGSFAALALSATPPTVESVWSILRVRRLDVVSALVLSGIATSLVLLAFGGDERVLLLRESLVTSIIGVAIAGSALARKPILFYLFRQVAAGDPTQLAHWDVRWEREAVLRRSMRIMSAVWGGWLVFEMAVRTVMASAMEISSFLLVSPFVQYGMTGLLVIWTVMYVRHQPIMQRGEPPG